MIDSLINGLGGLLGRNFIFSSVVPAAVLVLGNLLIASLAIGIGGVVMWFGQLDMVLQSALLLLLVGGVFSLSVVHSALKGSILSFWSGALLDATPLGKLLKARHEKVFKQLTDSKFETSPWRAVDEKLKASVLPIWQDDDRISLDDGGKEAVARALESAGRVQTAEQFTEGALQDAIAIVAKYKSKELSEFYRRLRQMILIAGDSDEMRIRQTRVQLDRSYGTFETIRSTALGNIVESYNQYPSLRYKIDGDILWPRLVQVTSDGFNANLQEKKALLDFCLGIATACALSAIAVVIYGPFGWPGLDWLLIWYATAGGLVTASYAFYRAAIPAALDFGHTLRAACDLFRIELMEALHRPSPTTLKQERKQWEEISQLAIYGTVDDFPLRSQAQQPIDR